MGTWWSHHGETLVSTSVGVVFTILISVIVVRYQKSFRRLSYSVIARQRLVPLTGYQEYSDLQIQFRKNPVNQPWIIIIRIINTGRQDIGPDDITKPICIDVGNNDCIRDARVTDSAPQDVYEATPLELDKIGRPFLKPVAINQGNSIQIQLLLDGEPEKVTVVGRGVGIDVLTELEAQRRDERASATARVRQLQFVTSVLLLLSLICVPAAIFSFYQARQAQTALAEISVPTSATIVKPSPGMMVTGRALVTGTVKNLSPGNILWAIISVGDSSVYYPYGPCPTSGQAFSCQLYLVPSHGKTVTIYIVNANAQAVTLFTDKNLGKVLKALPGGAVFLSAVTVTVS